MNTPLLRRIAPAELPARQRDALDPSALREAAAIVQDVRERGELALREYAARLDGLSAAEPLLLPRDALRAALDELPRAERAMLERVAKRIAAFATAQRACLSDLTTAIPGGAAGHLVLPVHAAGCYAPGGRYPLISSMLMTAVTARVAGVPRVWAASPNPGLRMRAAAAIADVDGLLTAGGPHAVAALAFGAGPAPRCDVIVGPGNRWVTAAKYCVSAHVRIDMLAGPSELLVLADDSASPESVAADLLAQAEHDEDAIPMLVATSQALLDAVEDALQRQLADLPTQAAAMAALRNGFAALAADLAAGVQLCNQIAPEHLALHVRGAEEVARRVRNCGCVFAGPAAAEVLGDYGAGPNHTLPTGGAARFHSGLSVFSFLRQQTWLRGEAGAAMDALLADTAAMARLEGLEAHARSAELRDSRWRGQHDAQG